VIGHAREVELEMMRAGARGGGVRQRERGSVRAGGGSWACGGDWDDEMVMEPWKETQAAGFDQFYESR
jgi:hypothetical protein